MELRQIEYFLEVARREHVTRAAETLHVAQSAVSRQIALLEDELGAPLFERIGRNIRLTACGRIFLTYAERGLQELTQAKQKIREQLQHETSLIRLGVSTSLSAQLLPAMLRTFRQVYPDIAFQLRQETIPCLIRLIDQGILDLAIVSPLPEHQKTVIGTPLFSEQMIVLLPERHRLAGRSSTFLNPLHDERFLMFRSTVYYQDRFRDACQRAGFEPNIVFEGEDLDTIRALAAAGFGVAIVPEHAASGNMPPDMAAVSINAPELSRTIGVIRPGNRKMGPTGKLFAGFILEHWKHPAFFGNTQ